MTRPDPILIEGFTNFVPIGTGGFSTVYAASDERHARDVAIKVLTNQSLDPTIQQSFEREVTAMGKLGDHPYIMPVFQSGFSENGSPFLVMPLLRGGSYGKRIETAGAIDSVGVVDIAIKVLSALETAHRRNILHRDIKPSNVLVGNYAGQPLLADFGISTLVDSGKTSTKATANTLAYAAPEVFEGFKHTSASDIYSLGITLREMLTGQPAFSTENVAAQMDEILGESPRPLPEDLDPGLSSIFDDMVAGDPAERPGSCLEIAERLQKFQGTPTQILVGDQTRSVASTETSAQQTPASGFSASSSEPPIHAEVAKFGNQFSTARSPQVVYPSVAAPGASLSTQSAVKGSQYLAIFVAALAVILMAGVGIFLLLDSNKTEPLTAPASQVSPVVGTWNGDISQPNAATQQNYPAVIQIEIDADGQFSGSSNYPTLECGGDLEQVAAGDGSLTVRETITYDNGSGCVPIGIINLESQIDGSLRYEWYPTEVNDSPESVGIFTSP